jgi:hypothetical protein
MPLYRKDRALGVAIRIFADALHFGDRLQHE